MTLHSQINPIGHIKAYKKLFVSCNPTLTSFLFKTIPTLKFFPASQLPINLKYA